LLLQPEQQLQVLQLVHPQVEHPHPAGMLVIGLFEDTNVLDSFGC